MAKTSNVVTINLVLTLITLGFAINPFKTDDSSSRLYSVTSESPNVTTANSVSKMSWLKWMPQDHLLSDIIGANRCLDMLNSTIRSNSVQERNLQNTEPG
jgi:hypothetical protein